MAFLESDIIAQLPDLIWRGLKAPTDIGGPEFRLRQAARAYPYVDGEGHEYTGREATPIPATLFFLDSLMDDPVGGWNAWLPELLDGRMGDLQHPLLGPLNARVVSFRPNIGARVRNGFAVEVTWVETIADPTTPTIFALVSDVEGGGLGAVASAADAAASELGIAFPGGVGPGGALNTAILPRRPSGEPVLSLAEAIAVLEGAVFATEIAAQAFAMQLLGWVGTMVEAAEALEDPRAWVGIELLQRVWLGVQQIADRLVRLTPRPTARRTLARDTTLERFAADVKNTISDVASLNPFALRAQIVPQGSTLTYYTA